MHSGNQFTGSQSERVSFGNYLKQYDDGTLRPNDVLSRSLHSKFPEIEARLIAYIDLRAEKCKNDKLGVSWQCLESRALKYAGQLGIPENEFRASPGWISSTLKRHNQV